MTTQEFNELSKRYARHNVFLMEQAIGRAVNRREFMIDSYVCQLAEAFNIARDHYRGHLLTLLQHGLRQNLPFTYILEEMENYRTELKQVVKTEVGLKVLVLFDQAVFEDGYKAKFKILLEFIARISVARFLKQQIHKNYPLALVGDPSPDEPVIFDITDDFITQVADTPQPVKNAIEEKPRRTEYPELMNAEEAAEYLNTTVSSLYQMTSARQVPFYKRGRKLVFRKSELTNWRVEKFITEDEMKTRSADHLVSKRGRR